MIGFQRILRSLFLESQFHINAFMGVKRLEIAKFFSFFKCRKQITRKWKKAFI